MSSLVVAAGGGGDVIAAAVLASRAPGEVVGIATLAWDRLIVDPLPGPRAASDFTGLDTRPGYLIVTADCRPIPPAGSTLPRLAAELHLPLVLLDPAAGAVGLRRQLVAAADDLAAATFELVDVGGDILGCPTDSTLRSPFADSLTAAAAYGLPVTVLVAGPGLDGELSESVALERIGHDSHAYELNATIWEPFLPILEWHPSEATALLAAASRGLRGRVEIRDAGLPVVMTDRSPTVHELPPAKVMQLNPVAAALVGSQTFAEAEQAAVKVLGWTELDYERKKAQRVRSRTVPSDAELKARLRAWEVDARQRGVDFVTFRRLTEVLGHPDVAWLRAWLVGRWPERDRTPLWTLAPM